MVRIYSDLMSVEMQTVSKSYQNQVFISSMAGTIFVNFAITAHWLIAEQGLVKFRYN